MSFKLTYATMFEPPPALHTRFDAAVTQVRERLGGRYYLHIDGEDRAASRYFTKSNPANTQEILGEFAAAGAEDADAAVRAAAAAWFLEAHAGNPARGLIRHVAQLIRARVRHGGRFVAGGGQEPHGTRGYRRRPISSRCTAGL